MKHARLSPSSSARWLYCTASVQAIEDAIAAGIIQPDQSSRAADEGTFAHGISEDALLNGCVADGYLETPSECGRFVCDEDMSRYVQQYLDYVRGFMHEGTTVWIEEAWPLFYSEDENGYCDCAIYDPAEKRLHTFDLKYGMGFVSAENNSQFRIYAGCILDTVDSFMDIESVVCHVCQPRINNFGSEVLTDIELRGFMDTTRFTAGRIQSGEVEFCPGEKTCQWCPLSGMCKAQAEHALDVVQAEFDDLTVAPGELPLPDLKTLTSLEISHIFAHRKQLRAYLNSVEKLIPGMAERGDLPGHKRVQDWGYRSWSDEEAALKFMTGTLKIKKDDAAPRKIVSPAQLEKLVDTKNLSTRGANKLASLITRPEKVSVVPMSDEREALPTIADEFEVIETPNQTQTEEL